jgi:hypothetical protein
MAEMTFETASLKSIRHKFTRRNGISDMPVKIYAKENI